MKADEFELAVREHLAGELKRRFNTFTEKAYRGERTGFRHNVDIACEGEVGGDGALTLVECKFHEIPITSDQVMAFAFRLADIGARKGIYVSSSGYQLGSYKIASAVGMSLLLCVRRSPDYQLAAATGNLALQVFMSGQARKGNIQYAQLVSDVQCCPIGDVVAFVSDELAGNSDST
ncbi:MAG: hypothetical protein JSU74_03640 [Candidatus Zixiibacteriota bacterium]|nr:MAG: hypothetical protein JSU74_03640 [candidate division Zixibacteria bacterium]